MKYFGILLWIVLTTSWAHSQTVVHAVHWEKGVNKKVVKEWTNSLDKVSTISSTTYIKKKVGGKDKLHRNGHRDVIVWVPETSDLTKDFITVIWFHGHWGYFPKRTFEDRTLSQFVPLARLSNFVVVIPEMPWSIHTSTPRKRNSLLWMNPGDFMKFVNQVENTLFNHINSRFSNVIKAKRSLGKIDYRIVGHSAGGSTIKRLGITGDLCKLNPSMVVWSDSSYGRWLDDAWEGCLKSYDILVKVYVKKWGPPWKNATRFLGQFQGPNKSLELYVKDKGWSHKLIGNNIVKLSDLLGEKIESN